MDRGHRAQARPAAAGRDREHQAGASAAGGLHGEQALPTRHGHAGECHSTYDRYDDCDFQAVGKRLSSICKCTREEMRQHRDVRWARVHT